MKLEILEKDGFYHIYNRGINGCKIFNNEENKNYFLKLVSKYLQSKVTLLSYCLLDNHYHFLVKVNVDNKEVTQAFSNLFNAYAKAFNKSIGRTGSLFEKHFKRKRIQDEKYLKNTIIYIHKNPENHKLVNDFKEYRFSSYRKIISNNNTLINVNEVISLFEDVDNFIYSHKNFQTKDVYLQGSENLAGDSENLAGSSKNLGGTLKNLPKTSKKKTSLKEKFYQYIQNLQDQITSKLE
ncbi:MAG: transposase, partial [Polaribacter sp.]